MTSTSSQQQSKTYNASCLEGGQAILVDGLGSDTIWKKAQVLTDFSFPWIRRKPPMTEFRAMWEWERFYFRFDVTDEDVVLGEGANATERVIASDRVEIFFSTSLDLNPYYGLEIDPRGEVLDYEARYHRLMNWDWSCDGLVIKTSLTPAGYIVEGSVAMSTFRDLDCLHTDDLGDYLIAGLYRAEFSHAPDGGPIIEDWMSWLDPQTETPDFHVPTSFGKIRFEP